VIKPHKNRDSAEDISSDTTKELQDENNNILYFEVSSTVELQSIFPEAHVN
jgi:hypothetical protein